MKAAQINKYGGSEVIEINSHAQEPSLKKDQVLVEVFAASINPIDKALMVGYLQKMINLPFPITQGGDFSGVIKEIGENVSEFQVGDEVYGQAGIYNGGSGSFAQFTVANNANTSLKPKSINFAEAASLPLAGVSALQAIEESIALKKDEKILIQGGAGGIGSLAIQLAKLHGAYVAATTSKDTQDFVKNLGADLVIDYETEKFEDTVREYDAVFDTVGGEVTNRSLKVLKDGGNLVTMIGEPNQDLAKEHQINAFVQMTGTTTTRLTRLAELIDSGKIITQIDKVFPLEKVKDGFDYLEKEHQKGKVVIKIK